jgi:hypothetical protein
MDTRLTAVMRHDSQVALKDIPIDNHAGRREIFFGEVFQVMPGDTALDLGIVIGRTREKSWLHRENPLAA